MAILALETAAGQCAVALLRDDDAAFTKIEPGLRGQSERLLPMVEALLAEANLEYAALQAVAVTTGPGSFTGLRVGLAAAQGLALALGIPAIGIDSFTTFAAEYDSDLPCLIVIESRREELYWRLFGKESEFVDPGGCDVPETIVARLPSGPFTIMGDAAVRLRPYLEGRDKVCFQESPAGPSPLAVARLARHLLHTGQNLPPALPLYMRIPDAKPATR